MAYPTPQVTKTTAATFIPEIWSDEVVAAYKKHLVAANVFKKMSFKGKKGDTVNIPSPARGSASVKAASTAVTLIAATETNIPVLINKHYEYSRFIEDIVEVQALSSLRRFYTDDAGYSLAKQIDTDMVQLGRTFNGGAATAAYTAGFAGGDGTTAYVAGSNNQSALTDAAIRRTIQRLDDNDVPTEGRFFMIPPSARNTLMGLDRYTAMDFVGEAGNANTIRNGQIGNLYGMPVYVSSNCDTTSGSAAARVALMGHKDAAVLVEQLGIRSQTQYKQDYLSTLYTSDTLYGVKELRDNSAFALVVPA
jgi:N4-gp56 family major capsid protein|tara:strand:+ start:1918 stop:2838 length:921 start_codon:yes stop_codon:yes gene_type:complete